MPPFAVLPLTGPPPAAAGCPSSSASGIATGLALLSSSGFIRLSQSSAIQTRRETTDGAKTCSSRAQDGSECRRPPPLQIRRSNTRRRRLNADASTPWTDVGRLKTARTSPAGTQSRVDAEEKIPRHRGDRFPATKQQLAGNARVLCCNRYLIYSWRVTELKTGATAPLTYPAE